MITKDDLISRFKQMVQIEEKMRADYDTLKLQVQHAEYRKFFTKMAAEEQAHAAQISELIQLFDE